MSLIPKRLPGTGTVVLSSAINSTYYPSLNGLRAISILIVLMSHLDMYPNKFYAMAFNGGLGVNIFFVISGFLITTLCIKERNASGTIALKEFYIRRVLRIFPVAYLYILVIFILNYFFHLDIAWFQFPGALLYIMNFNYFRANQFSWYLGHFWSLANEEQFYLIFPFILKKNFQLFKWINVFLICVLPLICLLQGYVPALNHGMMYGFTHYLIKFQAISIGCLFSILVFEKRFDGRRLMKYKIPGNLVSIFLIFYLNYDAFYSIHAVYTNLVISLVTAYIIITNIIPANDVIFKFLNLKPVSFIGILSYSIYIWQQIFTSKDGKLPWIMVTFPFNIAFIVVVPLLSYFFYERYFLKLKKKFAKLSLSKATVI
jgi:peptidoglycan/LPS O-acetylase OafA/YrhL